MDVAGASGLAVDERAADVKAGDSVASNPKIRTDAGRGQVDISSERLVATKAVVGENPARDRSDERPKTSDWNHWRYDAIAQHDPIVPGAAVQIIAAHRALAAQRDLLTIRYRLTGVLAVQLGQHAEAERQSDLSGHVQLAVGIGRIEHPTARELGEGGARVWAINAAGTAVDAYVERCGAQAICPVVGPLSVELKDIDRIVENACAAEEGIARLMADFDPAADVAG